MPNALILFLSLSFVLTAPLYAEDTRLEKLTEGWNTAKSKAAKVMIRAFDQRISAIRKDRTVDAQLRDHQIEKITEQKKAFEQHGELPDNGDMLSVSLTYLSTLHNAASGVRQYFNTELEKSLGTDKFDEIQSAKVSWEQDLPGTSELMARTEYHGTIWFHDRATDLHLHITSTDGELFTCDMWRDVGNINLKRGWRYQGKLNGNQLQLVSTETLFGPPVKLELSGYIVGRRMILTVTTADGKPPAKPPLISIWRK